MFNDDKWRLDKAAAGTENNAKRIEEMEKEIAKLKKRLDRLEDKEERYPLGGIDY